MAHIREGKNTIRVEVKVNGVRLGKTFPKTPEGREDAQAWAEHYDSVPRKRTSKKVVVPAKGRMWKRLVASLAEHWNLPDLALHLNVTVDEIKAIHKEVLKERLIEERNRLMELRGEK